METARMMIQGDNIYTIIDLITKKENISYNYRAGDVVILMEEEYFSRIKSNLMAVYIFNFKDKKTLEIEIVVGGGQGEMPIDWGAEKSQNKKMAYSIIDICKENSWSIVDIYPERFKESLEKSAAQQLMESVGKWFRK